MPADGTSLKRAWIKLARYGLRRKFIRVMGQPLKGYQWTTSRSYEYLLGTHESPEVINRFLSWLGPASTFYDVGGNAGYFSFIASTVITRGQILAFEPMATNIAIFQEHLRRNSRRAGTSRITLIPCAVADREKTVQFTNDPVLTGSNTYVDSQFLNPTVEKIDVKCVSIDGLVASGSPAPDVIKIDVEGAEFDVLLGAEQTLHTHRPHLLLATHDVHVPGIDRQCVNFLKGLGYTLTNIGDFNPRMAGLDDYIATHPARSAASRFAA
jgi:FkbM family methyltransferase